MHGAHAISFIGKILGGITGANKAAKTAANAATESARLSTGVAREVFQGTTARLDPYSTRGNQAGEQYNALIGLPSSVTPQAAQSGFQNYLNNFGYQSELDEGSAAILGNQASRRLLGSGSTLKALQRFGVGLRGQFGQNYLNLVGGQQAAGLSAAGALAGVGTNYTGQIGAINDSRASAIGNAALAKSASNTNFLSGLISAAATLSDERTKTDIKRIGKLDDGLGVYRYRYRGRPELHVGVMAQEVDKKRPDASGPTTADGYRTVNYLQLVEGM